MEIGKAELLRDGTDVVIAAIGQTVIPAFRAAQDLAPLGINAAVVNARFVKPLDKEMFRALLLRVPRVITVEDHVITGGFGSALIEFMADDGITGVEVKRLGVPDRFIPHGTQDELRKLCGFDKDAIAQTALQMVRRDQEEKQGGMGKRERLDVLLVERQLVGSREEGRRKILAGEVLVNDQLVTKAGSLIDTRLRSPRQDPIPLRRPWRFQAGKSAQRIRHRRLW